MASAPVPSNRKWWGLAFLALPTILLSSDLTLLHLALPSIAIDLDPSSTQALWIMDAYGFMIAGFLITMGTLGDRIGRRKLLALGSCAIALASVWAACSTSPLMLIMARAFMGVAAASLMPSTLALISNMFDNPRERTLAIGIWATLFALGMAIGPLLGGAILHWFSWRSCFLPALPIALIIVAGAGYLLPEYKAAQAERLDLLSVVLSLAGILPIVYGIKEIARGDPQVISFIAMLLGAGFLVLFALRQLRLEHPLIDIRLFKEKSFSAILIILLASWIAVAGIMLLISQYLQLVVGLSTLMAGLWMGLAALFQVASGTIAPLLIPYVSPRVQVAVGMLISAAGFVLITLIGNHSIALAISGFAISYIGLGVVAALGTDLVVGSVPAHKAGAAAAMSESVQDLGVSLGIAALGSLATALYRAHISAELPAGLANTAATPLRDSLWSALKAGNDIPAPLIEQARGVFTHSLAMAAIAAALIVVALALLAFSQLEKHTA